jgi:hypothetical protein
MKKTSLILAALFAAAWAAAPLAVRANDSDDECEDCGKNGPGGGDRMGDRGPDRGERGERMGDRDERGDRGDRGGERGGGGRGPREGGHGGPMGGPGGRMGGPGMDPEMREKMEKLHGLEMKLRELRDKISRASDSEKAASKAEARKLIGELFDAKLAMETAMVAKMEKHLAEMKEKVAKKKSSREKMIDSKLSRIMGENDDWD